MYSRKMISLMEVILSRKEKMKSSKRGRMSRIFGQQPAGKLSNSQTKNPLSPTQTPTQK